jgi:DNA-binding beta-propeller fold protein YncE
MNKVRERTARVPALNFKLQALTLCCVGLLVFAASAAAQPQVARVKRTSALPNALGKLRYSYSVAVDSKGDVYVADTGNNRIVKLTGNGSNGKAIGKAGRGKGSFSKLEDIEVDAAGNIYTADSQNNLVQKMTPDGAVAWAATIKTPQGLGVAGDGTVYVSSALDHKVIRLGPNGESQKEWGSFGSDKGQFQYPHDIVIDKEGNVYVADFANARIQKFRNDGTFITAWGELGDGNGQFHNPWGLAIDSTGNIWVSDMGNHRLQIFTADGKFVGSQGHFSENASGPNDFNFPKGIKFGPNGDLFVAQPGVHAVDRLSVKR